MPSGWPGHREIGEGLRVDRRQQRHGDQARARRGLPAARAARPRSIARPPEACTFRSDAPERAAAATAPATVLGMSWNFRSRKTFALSRDFRDERGPLRDEGLEADLEPADLRAEAARRREDLRPRREVERDAEPSRCGSSFGSRVDERRASDACARPTSDATVTPRAAQ